MIKLFVFLSCVVAAFATVLPRDNQQQYPYINEVQHGSNGFIEISSFTGNIQNDMLCLHLLNNDNGGFDFPTVQTVTPAFTLPTSGFYTIAGTTATGFTPNMVSSIVDSLLGIGSYLLVLDDCHAVGDVYRGTESVTDYAFIIAGGVNNYNGAIWTPFNGFSTPWESNPATNQNTNRRIYLLHGETGWYRPHIAFDYNQKTRDFQRFGLCTGTGSNSPNTVNLLGATDVCINTFYHDSYDSYAENQIFVFLGGAGSNVQPTPIDIDNNLLQITTFQYESKNMDRVITRATNRANRGFITGNVGMTNDNEHDFIVRVRENGFYLFRLDGDTYTGFSNPSNYISFYTYTRIDASVSTVPGTPFIYLLYDFDQNDYNDYSSSPVSLPYHEPDFYFGVDDIYVETFFSGVGTFVDNTLPTGSSLLFSYVVEQPGNFCFYLRPRLMFDYFLIADAENFFNCRANFACPSPTGLGNEFDVNWQVPEQETVTIRLHEQTGCVIMQVEDYFENGVHAFLQAEHFQNFRHFVLRTVRGNDVDTSVILDFTFGDPFMHMRKIDDNGGTIYFYGESDQISIKIPESQAIEDFSDFTFDYENEFKGIKRVKHKGTGPNEGEIIISFKGDNEHKLRIVYDSRALEADLAAFDDFVDFADFDIYDYDDYFNFSDFNDSGFPLAVFNE